MLYVAMTDNAMSGWGEARGKINKLVLECKDLTEAEIVYSNVVGHPDMEKVKIEQGKPKYNDKEVYTSFKTIREYSSWYKWNFGK